MCAGPTFASLHDALTGAGLHVGVEVQGDGHAIAVADPQGERRIALAVEGGFDRTAAVLVASMRLRECLTSAGRLPDLRCPDRECSGRWPEFLAIWPVRA